MLLNGTTTYTEVPNSPSINITTAFTAEAWLKTNASTGAYQGVFERYGVPDATGLNGGFIFRLTPGGKLEFYVLQSNQAGYGLTGSTSVTANAWHHVAAVCDGGQMRVYLDGSLDGSLNVSTLPSSGTANMFIGSSNWNTGRFNGLLDEARITTGALYSTGFVPDTHLTAGANTRGLWKFDDQTANDSSGNAAHAMLMGGASFSTDVPTRGDNSLSLNGTTGQVRVPYSTSLDIMGAFTVESWFKINDTDTNQYLVSCLTGSGGYILMANDGMPQLYIVNSAGQGDFAIAWPPNIGFGAWHHMAGVFDGSQIRIYLDGALCASKYTNVSPGSFAGSTLSIGGFQDGASAMVSGLVDEVRISAGALYTSNFAPQGHLTAGATTRGLWKFDGQTANDFSGQGNHGTRYGVTSYSTDVPVVNQPPTVSISSPANNQSFGNESNINISASAADADGTISKVEFFRGSTKLGEDTVAPYNWALNNATPGTYALTARATDNNGAATTSATVNITVALPFLSINATDISASEPGTDTGTFNISRTGGTSAPLTVSYSISGTATNGSDYATLGTSLTIPAGAFSQSIAINPVDDALVEGNETVVLTLSGSAAYNLGSPASASVNIADNDTSPPTVSLTAPSSGSAFNAPASITLNATAADSDGSISKVEFFQGTTKLGEDLNAPYSLIWNNVVAGSYSLTALATDNAGASTTSTPVNIIVNARPIVTLTSPPNHAAFLSGSNITITAAVSGSGGSISKVEFFQGATKLGEDTVAPYSFTWGNVAEGSYTLTAIATDNSGTVTSEPSNITVANFAAARLDPANRTGANDLFSRNFNWSVPLVTLSGRAGLDLNLALSYNSLVWVKSNSSILFDPDRGFPTPGFHFGFPVIQGPYRNTSVPGAVNSYILIGSSGERTELRQTAASNVYEAVDSSYLRLEYLGTGVMSLQGTDGSKLTYTSLNGQYECTEIKDQSGNYISVSYDPASGLLSTITDTLGRVININYDGHQNPISITQSWTVDGQQQQHTWATFGYENRVIETNFTELAVFGAVSSRLIPVLSQVGLDDGTRYRFSYNGRGQVERITRSAQESGGQWVDLSYTSYTLPASNTDCARVTESSFWVKDWNNNVPVSTTYAVEGDMQVLTLPDGTQEKVKYATTGWQRGLVTSTETWGTVDGVHARRRWTTTQWTQDNEALSYALNPRILQTSVNDPEENHRRTEFEYLAPSELLWPLPTKVKEFRGNESTPLRSTETTYELNTAYTNLRLIGLVKEQRSYDGTGALQSRVENLYDYGQTGCIEEFEGGSSATQHDPAYTTASIRGLACRTRRWNVGTVDASTPAFVEHRLTYNRAGSIVSSTDPNGHKTTLSYQDNFSNSGNHHSYAFPTAETDPDQNAIVNPQQRRSSEIKYNFDTGQVTYGKDLKGAERFIEYDGARRRTRTRRRDSIEGADKGFTSWVYGAAQSYVQTFTQIDTGVEAYGLAVFDGAGRTRATASLLPGSVGGYSGQHIVYDKLGRSVKRSHPVEMTNLWAVAGDDAPPAGSGWVYNTQAFDWKGRMTSSTDGGTREFLYSGCGCAGGNTVVSRDELGRRQKMFYDIFGRLWKTQVLFEQPKTQTLNGSGEVYSTVVNSYNARDQLTEIKQYQGQETVDGSCPADTCQQTVLEYDGHGRLKSSHAPVQDAGKSTTYQYTDDDTVRSVTDARGASTSYTVNRRHLVISLAYSSPEGVPAAPNASFEYDAAGNRILMIDGAGRTDYSYDPLSRLTSEARQFNGLQGTYTLSYSYNMADELTNISDSTFNTSVSYSYDQAGRPITVAGSGFPNVSQFISGTQYRAWGAVKTMTYGDGRSLSVDYNAHLQPSSYKLPGLFDKTYDYYEDGRLSYAGDHIDPRYDRLHRYDHAGRLLETRTGQQARGGSVTDGPYSQNYHYDVWGNNDSRVAKHWSADNSLTTPYINSRNSFWTYDGAGNITDDRFHLFSYDAAGRLAKSSYGQWDDIVRSFYDGDGHRVRTETQAHVNQPPAVNYHLRSTPLGGQVVADITNNVQKSTGYVFNPGGGLLATDGFNGGGIVKIHLADATGLSQRETTLGNYNAASGTEVDAVGADVGREDPYLDETPTYEPPDETSPNFPSYGNPVGPGVGCNWNGIPVNCSDLMMLVGNRPQGEIRSYVARLENVTTLLGVRYGDIDVKATGASDRPTEVDADEVVPVNAGRIPLYRIVGELRTLRYVASPTGWSLLDGGQRTINVNVDFLQPHDVIGEKWRPKIVGMIKDIFGNAACRQAFKDAGFDLEVVGAKGFKIGSASLLTDKNISDAQVALPSAARQAAASKISGVYGLTVMLSSGADLRPRMFFTQDAFTAGGLFSSAESSFKQVLVHELIHAAGAPGKAPGWWGYLGYDDLSYMQKQYKKINAACN